MDRNRAIRICHIMLDGGTIKLTKSGLHKLKRTSVNLAQLMVHDMNSAGTLTLFDGQSLYPEAVDINDVQLSKGDSYFDTITEAIDDALDQAMERGYEVVDEATFNPPLEMERATKSHFVLKKNGKEVIERLHVGLYKMRSGKVELTTYIN